MNHGFWLAGTFAFCIALLTQSPPVSVASEIPSQEADALKPEWGTIFPASQAVSLFTGGNTIAGAWTPSEADIQLLEPRLVSEMRKELSKERWAGKTFRASNYYRQYGGIYANSRRLIVINGFHRRILKFGTNNKTDPDFWKRRVVGAYDGGCDYFHAAFDTRARVFVYLFCNGNA